jgi:hypothetical protein
MRRLLPLIALLLPTPALADVTASYTAGSTVMTVEVDDGGNARAGIDGKFVLIRRDGIDYVVVWGRDGAPHVMRADAALAHLGGKAPPAGKAWKTELSAAGDATVAGHPGSVWRFGPAGEPPLEFVMSPDPTLAPVGQVFARAADAFGQFIDAHATPNGDAAAGARSLLSHGTPIRIRETRIEPSPGKIALELKSVSTTEIDSHRFDLPGPVMTPDAFFAEMEPAPSDYTATVEIPNPKP